MTLRLLPKPLAKCAGSNKELPAYLRMLERQRSRHRAKYVAKGPQGAILRVEPKPDSLKLCRKCNDKCPIQCFDRRKTSPDFHATECKACKALRKKGPQ